MYLRRDFYVVDGVPVPVPVELAMVEAEDDADFDFTLDVVKEELLDAVEVGVRQYALANGFAASGDEISEAREFFGKWIEDSAREVYDAEKSGVDSEFHLAGAHDQSSHGNWAVQGDIPIDNIIGKKAEDKAEKFLKGLFGKRGKLVGPVGVVSIGHRTPEQKAAAASKSEAGSADRERAASLDKVEREYQAHLSRSQKAGEDYVKEVSASLNKVFDSPPVRIIKKTFGLLVRKTLGIVGRLMTSKTTKAGNMLIKTPDFEIGSEVGAITKWIGAKRVEKARKARIAEIQRRYRQRLRREA